MANDKNLIPVTERTKSEAREISRAGGIASGIARRERKNLREICREMLEEKIQLSNGDTITKGALIVAKQMEKAAKQQDTTAAKFIAELSGDMQQQIAISTDTETAAAIRAEFENQYRQE